jgi:hypothetical protein
MPITGSLDIPTQRVVTSYEIVRGLIVKITELQIPELDTDEWKVIARTTEDTNKTQPELITEMTAGMNAVAALHQAEIDKVAAAVES